MASSADSSEEEEKRQCCIPEAADRPLRHPLACSDSIRLVDDHCAPQMLAYSRRHYRGEVCSKVDISSQPSWAAGATVLPIRGYRFIWAVACLTQLASSFSNGGCPGLECISSVDSFQEDTYESSFEISPTELVESILTLPERSREGLKGRLYESDANGSRVLTHEAVSKPLDEVPSFSTILRVKVMLDINGGKCSYILTSKHQDIVKALKWKPFSLKMATVHCKRGTCVSSASYPGHNASVKSEVSSSSSVALPVFNFYI
ncbi:hypothetical protein VPH35_112605 [Triticum aestivum]